MDTNIKEFTGLYDRTKFSELLLEEQDEFKKDGKTEKDWIGRKIFTGDILDSDNKVVSFHTTQTDK